MTKAITPAAQFKHDLVTRQKDFSEVLPPNISFDQFRAAAMTMVHTAPDVIQCTRASILTSLMKCAADGLVPDGREAALVTFNSKRGKTAAYMPMVGGLIKRVRNSGEVVSIWSEVVYENEKLTVWAEDGERRWRHEFDAMSRTGEIRGAYAVAKLADGTIEFEPMDRAEIEKVRAVSRAKDSGPWKDWFSEMARKTVIRRLCKRLPIKSEDQRMIQSSDRDTIPMKDVTPQRTLAERLLEPKGDEPEDAPPDGAIEGEIMDQTAFAWKDETLDLTAAFPGSDAFDAGVKACEAGESWETCPYEGEEAQDWLGGWFGKAGA